MTSPDQSKTPRTDAEEFSLSDFGDKEDCVVRSDFAHTLERECIQLREELKNNNDAFIAIERLAEALKPVINLRNHYWEELQSERDQLKKRVEEAERILRLHISAIRPDEENGVFAAATNFLNQGKP